MSDLRKQSAAALQPPPRPGNERVLDLVLADLTERAEAGKAKYGRYLETHNGRDPLWDAYQEAIDLCMYLRQEIGERKMTSGGSASRHRLDPIDFAIWYARADREGPLMGVVYDYLRHAYPECAISVGKVGDAEPPGSLTAVITSLYREIRLDVPVTSWSLYLRLLDRLAQVLRVEHFFSLIKELSE